jgi:hypothetical protein
LKKKSDQNTIPCVKCGPLCVFYFRNFHVISCSSGSHHDLEISFNLNDYYSFTTTTLDSVNVKISGNLKQKLFLWFFFQNTSHFHTNWLIFEGLGAYLAIGNPKPISKIFRFFFTGTQNLFLKTLSYPESLIHPTAHPKEVCSIRCETYQNIKQDNITQ